MTKQYVKTLIKRPWCLLQQCTSTPGACLRPAFIRYRAFMETRPKSPAFIRDRLHKVILFTTVYTNHFNAQLHTGSTPPGCRQSASTPAKIRILHAQKIRHNSYCYGYVVPGTVADILALLASSSLIAFPLTISATVDTELFRRLNLTGVFFRIGQRFQFESNVIWMFFLRITVKTRSRSCNIFMSAVGLF